MAGLGQTATWPDKWAMSGRPSAADIRLASECPTLFPSRRREVVVDIGRQDIHDKDRDLNGALRYDFRGGSGAAVALSRSRGRSVSSTSKTGPSSGRERAHKTSPEIEP